MEKYELKTDGFEGPLEKLLGLIEAKELEITRLSLAEVTADFLKYVESLGEVDSRVLADFIVVAARLILIKSHALLPHLTLTEEEEEDIADLERRLRLYKEFRAAEKAISASWDKNISYAREYLLELPQGFYLSENVSPTQLRDMMERLYEELQAFIPKTDEAEIKLVSLEQMIEEMIVRVSEAINTSFTKITEGRGRPEIIVLFLALLHLLKESKIEITQENTYSEIQIAISNG